MYVLCLCNFSALTPARVFAFGFALAFFGCASYAVVLEKEVDKNVMNDDTGNITTNLLV